MGGVGVPGGGTKFCVARAIGIAEVERAEGIEGVEEVEGTEGIEGVEEAEGTEGIETGTIEGIPGNPFAPICDITCCINYKSG